MHNVVYLSFIMINQWNLLERNRARIFSSKMYRTIRNSHYLRTHVYICTVSPISHMFILKQRGDTIDIIAMNPSGLWRGRCQGRIGHFKFINVELLPDRHVLRSSEQRKKSVTSQKILIGLSKEVSYNSVS